MPWNVAGGDCFGPLMLLILYCVGSKSLPLEELGTSTAFGAEMGKHQRSCCVFQHPELKSLICIVYKLFKSVDFEVIHRLTDKRPFGREKWCRIVILILIEYIQNHLGPTSKLQPEKVNVLIISYFK